jgi:hypothetical protein
MGRQKTRRTKRVRPTLNRPASPTATTTWPATRPKTVRNWKGTPERALGPGSWRVCQAVYVKEIDGMEDIWYEQTFTSEDDAKAFAWEVWDEREQLPVEHLFWLDDDSHQTLHYQNRATNLWMNFEPDDPTSDVWLS